MMKLRQVRLAVLAASAFGAAVSVSLAQNDIEYAYDDLGRLSTVCYAASADLITYEYDDVGNRSEVRSEESACGPTVFSVDDASPVVEGTSLIFTIRRLGDTSGANDVGYATANGTAVTPADYTAASGTLSFAADEDEKNVTVQTIADAVFESSETVLLNLSSPTNGATIGDGAASGTLNNNAGASGVSFAIANASVTEGGSLSLTVTKTGATALMHDVDFATTDGTATAGSDYTGVSDTLSFGPSETTKSITISTTDDATFETDETVFVNLSNPTNGASITQSSGVGTINDNEAAPTFAISDESGAEGGTLVFTVTKTGATTLSHAVNFATANGTAVSASDYTAQSNTLTFAPSDTTKTISVQTGNDSDYENDETFNVNLSAPTNGAVISDAQGVGTIQNDDAAPSFSVNNASVSEGGNLVFTITKAGSTALTHLISYATSHTNAPADQAEANDYTATSGALSFTYSQTSKTVSVPTTENATPEPNEKIRLNLSNATNGATISDSVGVGTIVNDDNWPPVANPDDIGGTHPLYTTVSIYARDNDTDADNDPLTITQASCVSGGCSVTIASGGTHLRVTGTTEGKKTVNYTISDGNGGTDSSTAKTGIFMTQCGGGWC